MSVLNRAKHKTTGVFTQWVSSAADPTMTDHWDTGIVVADYTDFVIVAQLGGGDGGIPDTAIATPSSLDLSDGLPKTVAFTNTNADSYPGVLSASIAGVDAAKFALSGSNWTNIDFQTVVSQSNIRIPVLFNPDGHSGDTSLSADRKEFTNNVASWRSAAVNVQLTSGKWYWEVERVVSTSASGVIGMVAYGYSLTSYPGQDNNGWGISAVSGFFYENALTRDTAFTTLFNTDGDVLGIAYDADNRYVWASINGVWQNGAIIAEVESGDVSNGMILWNAANLYPAIAGFSGQTFKLRAIASELTYTVPTGFNALEEMSVPSVLEVSRVAGGIVGDTLSANVNILSSQGNYTIPLAATIPATPTYAQLIQTVGSSDGVEQIIDTGTTYTWYDSLSYWIRKEAADVSSASRELRQYFTGNVMPEEETQPPKGSAWTKAGRIYSQDGFLHIVGIGLPGSLKYTDYNSIPRIDRLIQFYIEVITLGTVDAVNTREFQIRNATKRFNLRWGHAASGGFARISGGNSMTPIGTVNNDVDLSDGIHFVEIFIDLITGTDYTMYVFFDNESTASLIGTLTGSTGGDAGFTNIFGQGSNTTTPDYDLNIRAKLFKYYGLN